MKWFRCSVRFQPSGPIVYHEESLTARSVHDGWRENQVDARADALDVLDEYARKCERAAWDIAKPRDPQNSRFD